MKIGIGNDHSALELKAEIIELLKERGHEVVDYGTNSPESCDYPVYGEKVGRAVASGEVERGILICGTGPVSYTHLTLPTTSALCRSRWSPYH